MGFEAWFWALVPLILVVAVLALGLRLWCRGRASPAVLQLTQYLGMGGLERVILNLARGLAQEGRIKPIVLVYDEVPGAPTLHEDFRAHGIEVIDTRKGPGVSLKVAGRLAGVCVRRRVSVIHSHDLSALIYAVFAKWATLGAVRVVHTQHSFVHINNGPHYKLMERVFTFFADTVCAVSEGLRKQYGTVGVNPARVKLVPNGMEFPACPLVDPTALRALRQKLIAEVAEPAVGQALRERIDWIWLLCMARVHPGKGQDQVLEVWNLLKGIEGKQVALIYLGQETATGALAALRKKIAVARDSTNVLYAGFTKKPADWRLGSHVFVSGSEFEGMPLGPIEAVGTGNEVLVSDIPGHSMLPAHVERFALSDKAAGARALEGIIRRFDGGFESTRREAWDRGREIRDTYGISRMTRIYSEYYR